MATQGFRCRVSGFRFQETEYGKKGVWANSLKDGKAGARAGLSLRAQRLALL